MLSALTQYARKTMGATQVALVGHSYGSYISAAAASDVQASGDIDAVVLTGFSGTVQYFAPFVAGAALRVASTLNPTRWGHLASSYLMSADRFALAYVYFAGDFNRTVADWTYDIEAEPFALGELPSLLDTPIAFDQVTAPVLVLQGRYDVSACGGDCVGLLNATAALFTGSKGVQTVDDLPAGSVLLFLLLVGLALTLWISQTRPQLARGSAPGVPNGLRLPQGAGCLNAAQGSLSARVSKGRKPFPRITST